MTEDIQQLVRQSLDKLTADATVPAGLAARARHLRRRRLATRAAILSTAAAAGAAAVLIGVSGPQQQAGTTRPASLTAFVVVSRARHALAQDAAGVVRATMTSPVASGPVVSWSDGSGSTTVLSSGPAGPGQAAGYLQRPGRVTVVTIDYGDRTWREKNLPASQQAGAALPAALFPLQTIYRLQVRQVTSGCSAATAAAPGIFALSWRSFVRQLLRCGAFTIAGSGRIGGAAAVRLVSHAPQFLTGTAVMWVSKVSYLPLRLSLSAPPSATRVAAGYQVGLAWLPATRANRARASILPVPAGFSQQPWPNG